MVATLVAVVVVLVVAGAVAVVIRSRQKAVTAGPDRSAVVPVDPLGPQDNLGGDPWQIKAGDVVAQGGERAFIRGSVRIREGAYQWVEHFFEADASGQRRWLSVEEDPDLQLAVWQDRPELDVDPNATTVQVDGITFRQVEQGHATYRTEGTTGLPASGTVDYVDFESGDGHLLGLERFDNGSWEASIGHGVGAHTLTIYPGQ